MTENPRQLEEARPAAADGARTRPQGLSLEKSRSIAERARRVIWKGGKESTQHEALRACGFPRFATRSSGNSFWDADGNQYVDYLMAWGAVVLGHGFAGVDEAAADQLSRGSLMNLAIEAEVRLAERLVEHIPSAELVRFVASGSEAAAAAVRIARHVTGREKIVHYGFHGWLDWCQNLHPAGILPAVLANTLTLKFNDAQALHEIFAANRGTIACVIMEPVKDEEPAEGYLEAVREITRSNGALLIFDEAKTGIRFGLGGAQVHYAVTPDLSVFSKAIANGYPLALLAGRADVFERADGVWVSGTYHGWPPAIAAANATLTVIEQKPVVEHIWSMGRRLMSGFNTLMEKHGFAARLSGAPPMPKVNAPDSETAQLRTLISKMLQRGYFIHPTHPWFISYAHDEACIDRTLQNIEDSLGEMRAP